MHDVINLQIGLKKAFLKQSVVNEMYFLNCGHINGMLFSFLKVYHSLCCFG